MGERFWPFDSLVMLKATFETVEGRLKLKLACFKGI